MLYVSWNVLGGFETPAKPGTERHAYQNALGVDRNEMRNRLPKRLSVSNGTV